MVAKTVISHRKRYTREYEVWAAMKQRCLNKNHKSFKNYGGRGITICEKWLTFEGFLEDMGNRPSEDRSLERIDNNKNYEPSNCCWATRKEQARNNRICKTIEVRGKRFKSISELAEYIGLPADTLRRRLRKLSLEEAISRPSFYSKNRGHSPVWP